MKRLLLLCPSLIVLSGCPATGIVCQAGTTRCGNGCNDLTTDSRNCGACGQPCFASQVCIDSACQCRSGTTLCNGACVVTENDPKFCGTCSHACATGEVCEASTCKADCTTGTRCGFSCIDTTNDAMNCGACGVTCPDSQSCHAGRCQWDMVAACFSTGQVVGLQSGSDQRGPLQPLGSGPLSLAQYGSVLLAADSIDDRLVQAKLPALSRLSEFNALGRAPNQVITDLPFVYVVNSVGHTVQVLQPIGDAGCPAVVQPDAGCAYATLDDGGVTLPLGADAGCFYPAVTDGGCADTQLDDGGVGPLSFADAGCFMPPPPPPPPEMPCFQMPSDAGLALATIGELDTGANTFPQAIEKANGALWVPLYGGFGFDSSAGQKLLKIDITNPKVPHTVSTIDLSALTHARDGGASIARPYAIVAHGGKLYVTLNNFDDNYVPAGPGVLAVIDPVDAGATTIDLGEGCLDPVCTIPDPASTKLFISCGGQTTYDMDFHVVSNTGFGVVMLDTTTNARASWSPQCPAANDGGCLPILPSRLAVRDGRVYLGDQNGGRIFVANVANGMLTERRGYAGAMGGPIQACGVDLAVGFSNVADILVLP